MHALCWEDDTACGALLAGFHARSYFPERVRRQDAADHLSRPRDRKGSLAASRAARARRIVPIDQQPDVAITGDRWIERVCLLRRFGLLSYGPDGNERWRLALGPFNNPNGHGSSPILADGKLVLICDQDTDSFLLAVDPASGRVLWKTTRPEYTHGYATPAVIRPKTGPVELIVPGSSKSRVFARNRREAVVGGRDSVAAQVLPLIDHDRIFVRVGKLAAMTSIGARSMT